MTYPVSLRRAAIPFAALLACAIPASAGAITTQTFTNSSNVAINSSNNNSTINVAGVATTVEDADVRLNGLTHANADDIEIVVSQPNDCPGGTSYLMSDVGGNNAVSGLNIRFSDQAANSLPDNGPLTSGTFKPSNGTGPAEYLCEPGHFPIPFSLAVMNGIDPNGAWNIYTFDDNNNGKVGALTGGWTLFLALNDRPVACFTTSSNQRRTAAYQFNSCATDDQGISSITWDFGDGTTGSGSSVSHTYATTDCFTVTQTVTDNDGAVTTQQQLVATRPGCA
jgi:hypothetical protein